jgi:hypothetical protein
VGGRGQVGLLKSGFVFPILPSLALTDVLTLGQRIASRPENLLGIPGGRQVFEDVVMIGGQQVRVRLVLNPSGALRSVHLRL